jgi:hypothetical protein
MGSLNLLRVLRYFAGVFEAPIRYNPTFTGSAMFESEPIKLLAPHLCWTTTSCSKGERVRGWVAGPMVVVSCHFLKGGASKPCRALMTKGAVGCYCADTPTATRQLGYLPIITPARERVVILMCATTARKASLLARTEAVEFARAKTARAMVHFNRLVPGELGESSPVFTQLKRQVHDIKEYLWRVLWQDAVLFQHFSIVTSAQAQTAAQAAAEPPAQAEQPIKYPPLVRRPRARDNAPSVADSVQGIGMTPDAA